MTPLIISHAACKGHAPENTLAGIEAALRFGVDAIEIDVHASRDGVPVLMHDEAVDRTTDGTGAIAAHSLAELRALDAGGDGYGGRFRGERIPTLAAVLDLTRGACLLVIEIKARDIERAVIDVVRGANAADDTMIWSFAPETVRAARHLAPEIPAAQLAAPRDVSIDAIFAGAVRRNAQAVSLYHSMIDTETVRRARLRGLTVYTWTADDPADQLRVAQSGVDGIVTNVPDVLRTTLAGTP